MWYSTYIIAAAYIRQLKFDISLILNGESDAVFFHIKLGLCNQTRGWI